MTGQTVLASQHNPPLEDLGASMTGSLPRNGSAGMTADINLGGYKAVNAAPGTNPADVVTLAQVQALIAAVSGAVTGELKAMTGTAVPVGYLLANGQSVLRATYPALWAYAQASGNIAATQAGKTAGQYGPGDGATTFTLPDLTTDGGQFIRPLGSGRTIGSSQADDIKSHIHTGTTNFDGLHQHAFIDSSVGGSSGQSSGGGSFLGPVAFDKVTAMGGTHAHDFITASAGGAETRVKNVSYPFVIKT